MHVKFLSYLVILALCIGVSGCGFRPMYGDITPSLSLNSLAIQTIPNREGQILRNLLMDKFYQQGMPANPSATLTIDPINERRVDLDLTKSSDVTRAQINLTSTMRVVDAQGRTLLTRPLKSLASYNVLNSEFATRVAADNARQNALADMARQIELFLSLPLEDRRP